MLLDDPYNQDISKLEFAGFWTRFFAALIDGILLSLVMGIFNITLESKLFLNIGINGLIMLLYYTYFESSVRQATIGKQLLNIKVVDKNGNRLTTNSAFIRNISKYLSAFILLIGYLMAAFDARKQALHDKLAGSFVVKV